MDGFYQDLVGLGWLTTESRKIMASARSGDDPREPWMMVWRAEELGQLGKDGGGIHREEKEVGINGSRHLLVVLKAYQPAWARQICKMIDEKRTRSDLREADRRALAAVEGLWTEMEADLRS